MAKQPGAEEDYSDILISDFTDSVFQAAFQQYFAEIGINVGDWNGLFQKMNEGDGNEKNAAYVRKRQDGEVIGFIMFIPIQFTNWFFDKTCGFIREFWVEEAFRNRGHGSDLIALAEQYFLGHSIYTSILTTDTAERFYKRHGYVKAYGCRAKNRDDVFVKRLK